MTATLAEPMGLDTPPEDLEALRGLVRATRRPGLARTVVVEVGSWVGRTAIAMADAGALVYCVDTWEGSDDPADDTQGVVGRLGGPRRVFEAFARNVGDRLMRSVFPCRGPSTLWAGVWPAKVDLVFIDGDHREEAVRADIQAWFRHVRPGGVLAGHDLGVYPGVEPAVRGLLSTYKQAGKFVWWAQVPGG
jgi:predicted O-methyltransferase YrrM